MARKCTICIHPQRKRIEQLILMGRESYRNIEHLFGVTIAALSRHKKNHMPQELFSESSGNHKSTLSTQCRHSYRDIDSEELNGLLKETAVDLDGLLESIAIDLDELIQLIEFDEEEFNKIKEQLIEETAVDLDELIKKTAVDYDELYDEEEFKRIMDQLNEEADRFFEEFIAEQDITHTSRTSHDNTER